MFTPWNMANNLIAYVNSTFEHMKGFYEIYRHETLIYRYKITSIDIRNWHTDLQVLVNYQTVGSRVIQQSLVSELNDQNAFHHFHPEHARIIVVLDTAQELYPKLAHAAKSDFFEVVKKCQRRIQNSMN